MLPELNIPPDEGDTDPFVPRASETRTILFPRVEGFFDRTRFVVGVSWFPLTRTVVLHPVPCFGLLIILPRKQAVVRLASKERSPFFIVSIALWSFVVGLAVAFGIFFGLRRTEPLRPTPAIATSNVVTLSPITVEGSAAQAASSSVSVVPSSVSVPTLPASVSVPAPKAKSWLTPNPHFSPSALPSESTRSILDERY